MAAEEGKESTIMPETSSGAVSSKNQTPKPLKAKRKISKKAVINAATSSSVLNNTPVQERRKILKKKIVARRKNINNNAEDVQNANSGDMEIKNVLTEEQSKNNHENFENKSVPVSKMIHDSNDTANSHNLNREELKEGNVISVENSKNNQKNLKRKKKVIVVRKKISKGNEEGCQAINVEESKTVINAGKSKKRPNIVEDKQQSHEKNRENFEGSKNKWLKQNVEDRNELSNKQYNQKNKEKLSGSVENERRIKREGKKHQLEGEWKEHGNKEVGGLILFCNAKTKSDCFRYHIMGVSPGRKDLLLDIKPGLKLFLYDFEIKLLYGIFSASSVGGTKLEPAAFNGAFPFQVRFDIYQDCYPLPESVFKRAIKENYNGKNKFDQELTFQQVNTLMELFKPTDVKSYALPVYPPQAVSVNWEEAKEKESKHLVHHHREPLAREPYAYDDGKRDYQQLNKNDEHLAYRGAPSVQRKASSEQLFLSEKDYRTYGLRREIRNITPPGSHISPTLGLELRVQDHSLVRPSRDAEKEYSTSYDHFPRQEWHSSDPRISASVASIVDTYLKVPYYGSANDPYQLPLRAEREELTSGSHNLGRRETTYQPDSSYLSRREIPPSQTKDYMMEASQGKRREKEDAGVIYTSYASKAVSGYNQVHTIEGAKPETLLGPVSGRYSFAGPSRPYL